MKRKVARSRMRAVGVFGLKLKSKSSIEQVCSKRAAFTLRVMPAASRLASSESPDTRAAGDAFEAILAGWRDQQLSRSLGEKTIDTRERLVRRFRQHAQV